MDVPISRTLNEKSISALLTIMFFYGLVRKAYYAFLTFLIVVSENRAGGITGTLASLYLDWAVPDRF